MTESKAPSPRRFDIAIVGAGAVGLAFAAVIQQAMGRRLAVAVIDPKPEASDGRLRTVALSEGSRRLLQRIGAWDLLEPKAQPILKMEIFDGGVRDPVRLKQLGFDAEPGETLAHMAFNDDVTATLRPVAAELGVKTIRGAVADLSVGRRMARLALVDGEALEARLIVAADGARSRLRTLAGIGTSGWDTGQSAIVATIAHEREHEGRAEQHFLPAGPFAILPMPGRQSSIVWNESHADAKVMLELHPEDLLRQIERRFTLKLGAISLASRVETYPLGFRFAREYVRERLALVGDAAHLVHPLAGQGLNLGLRDVAALAEHIIEPLRLGLDPAEPSVLQAYQRSRRFDVVSSGFGMDAINRLFSNDFGPVRALRDFGLRLVDRAAPLKRAFMQEAAGDGASAPRLMRGLGL